MNRLSAGLLASLGVAAIALLVPSGAAIAQLQLGPPSAPVTKPKPPHHKPPKRTDTAKPTAPSAAAPTPAAPPPAASAGSPASSGREPDLAFGAFQRGNYITAFSLATQRAADKDDPKSMTLLGELYANGLGVPQNDKKAEDWYKLAAARGDANAMFALGMFRMQGRAGARDRVESAKWLAAAAMLGHPIAAYDLELLYM